MVLPATALVTGAGSGIGAATARLLASRGVTVIVTDVDGAAAERVASTITEEGGRATPAALDVTDPDAWDHTTARAVEDHGPIGGLVNNAGVTRDRTLLRMSDEEWDSVLGVHLKGAWLGCRAMVPQMIDAGAGSIVNISSSGRHGSFGQANYSAAKAGLVGLTRTIALEHARHGIRANAVAPGAVDTPMTEKVPDRVKEAWIEGISLRRFAKPEEIAGAVSFLLSNDASYVNGHVLDVNGLEMHP